VASAIESNQAADEANQAADKAEEYEKATEESEEARELAILTRTSFFLFYCCCCCLLSHCFCSIGELNSFTRLVWGFVKDKSLVEQQLYALAFANMVNSKGTSNHHKGKPFSFSDHLGLQAE